MNCPICNNKSIVIDSRKHGNEQWKRRRECTDCLTRFNTYEFIDFDSLPDYVKQYALSK